MRKYSCKDVSIMFVTHLEVELLVKLVSIRDGRDVVECPKLVYLPTCPKLHLLDSFSWIEIKII